MSKSHFAISEVAILFSLFLKRLKSYPQA